MKIIISRASEKDLKIICESILPSLDHMSEVEHIELQKYCGNRKGVLWFNSLPSTPKVIKPPTRSGEKESGSRLEHSKQMMLPLTAIFY